MNLRLPRRTDATTPATSTVSDLSNSARSAASCCSRPLAGGSVHADRQARATAPPHLSAMTASQPLSRSSGCRSRPQIAAKKHSHRHRAARRTHRSSSSNHPFTYATSPFSQRHFSPAHQQQSHTLSSHPKSPLSILRRQIHLLKFKILLRLGQLRSWLSAKLGACKRAHCFATHHNPRNPKPDVPRRPFLSRGPSSYDASQLGLRAAAVVAGNGGNSGGYGGEVERNKKSGRIRRISQSTMKGLKKTCGLSSERSDLMEEDRRAMERLDELWRSRESDHV